MSSDEIEEAVAAGVADDAGNAKTAEPVETAELHTAADAEVADTEGEQRVTIELVDEAAVTDAAADGTAQGSGPRQGEMPFAMVEGKAFTNLPSDLYIPPDALEVILEAFEGPLDLLLYLIRRQNLDILEINVADITRQYMGYVEMMTAMRFELAAEYLVMAAMLAEIKSRMLLPRPPEAEEEEGEDPRAALIRRLQEYERFKTAAEDMDELPRMGRDVHQASATGPDRKLTRPEPEVDLKEVLVALADVLRRADMFESHQVEKEKLSTRERMTQVLDKIRHRQFVPFVSLFKAEEGRLGVVVTFLAVMELVKESLLELVQNEAFGAIHVRARGEVEQPSDELDDDAEFMDDDIDAERDAVANAEDAQSFGTPEPEVPSGTESDFDDEAPQVAENPVAAVAEPGTDSGLESDQEQETSVETADTPPVFS